MPSTLLAYSTVDGQTLRICHRLREVLEAAGNSVTLFEITHDASFDLAQFETVVIGASVRYGKHRPSVLQFIKRHLEVLQAKPCAFFSVNVVARKTGKDTPATNPYVQTLLHETGWTPTLLGLFAGRIDYPKYRFLDRQVIRLIMWLTNGPTDTATCTEFTNWHAVDTFAAQTAHLGRS